MCGVQGAHGGPGHPGSGAGTPFQARLGLVRRPAVLVWHGMELGRRPRASRTTVPPVRASRAYSKRVVVSMMSSSGLGAAEALPKSLNT